MAFKVPDSEYDKFKTPYLEIRIGNAKGGELHSLPESILRLIEKVEITETSAGCNITSQFNISFIEGSREPFKRSFGTSASSLYGTPITNSQGMLADLRFSDIGGTGGGFTSVIPSEVGLNKKSFSISSPGAVGLVSPKKGTTGGEIKDTTQIASEETAKLKNVSYVFQEKNIVEIKWGYLEDSHNMRTIRGNIIVVQYEFSESNDTRMSISCAGPGSWLDQLAPLNAVYFSDTKSAGMDDDGSPLYHFEDQNIETVLKKLFPDFNIIVSDNLLANKLGKGHSKLLPAGKSPEQFLRGLKRKTNAMYISYYSPKDGKPTIAYISRTEFMKKEVIKNRALFNYGNQGSILKTVSVKAEFNGLSGAGVVGVGSDGTITKAFTNNGAKAETYYPDKSIIDPSPASGNSIPEAENMNVNLFGNGALTVSKVEVSPAADEPEYLADTAQSLAACRNRLVVLEFSAIGYPSMTTGVVTFGGISQRFSGQYEVLTVTHVIDASSYTMRGTAQAAMIDGESGVVPADAQQGTVELETVQMFKSASTFKTVSPGLVGTSVASTSNGSSAMDEYIKDILA